jgi:hypothetical protein
MGDSIRSPLLLICFPQAGSWKGWVVWCARGRGKRELVATPVAAPLVATPACCDTCDRGSLLEARWSSVWDLEPWQGRATPVLPYHAYLFSFPYISFIGGVSPQVCDMTSRARLRLTTVKCVTSRVVRESDRGHGRSVGECCHRCCDDTTPLSLSTFFDGVRVMACDVT